VPPDTPQNLDARAFRLALGRFPTGVCVVTAVNGAERVGITVSSFNSVSLDPPLVLWSLLRSSPSLTAFKSADRFAISVLAADQAEISNRFASRIPHKFDGVAVCEGLAGIPLIDGAAAHFECRTWKHYDGGDHVIILGEVERFASWLRSPLVFAAGYYEALVLREGPLAAEELWPIALG
jgi:flavin reductase (DIM6/NTAB) family NADH-FMN oxidoreductase RutF